MFVSKSLNPQSHVSAFFSCALLIKCSSTSTWKGFIKRAPSVEACEILKDELFWAHRSYKSTSNNSHLKSNQVTRSTVDPVLLQSPLPQKGSSLPLFLRLDDYRAWPSPILSNHSSSPSEMTWNLFSFQHFISLLENKIIFFNFHYTFGILI